MRSGQGSANNACTTKKRRPRGTAGKRTGRYAWRTAASLPAAGRSVAKCVGGGIQARHIVLRLHQRVVRWEVLAVARGLPLLVLLLG
eukprot:8208593-Pyramimonas_sp.AAC.1